MFSCRFYLGHNPSPSSPSVPPSTSSNESVNPSVPRTKDTGPVFEGWNDNWSNSFPDYDISWLKTTHYYGLFERAEPTPTMRERYVFKEGRMWFHSPEAPAKVGNAPPTPGTFFRCPKVCFFRPVGAWGVKVPCPNDKCDKLLSRGGYSPTVRWVVDLDDHYALICETLACTSCKTRVVSTSDYVLSQLTDAHRDRFPAVLTQR